MTQNTGFRHYRNTTPEGERHLISNRGGVTLAFASPKHIDDLTADDTVAVAFSFCSADDNFERRRGRDHAVQRLSEAEPATMNGADFRNWLYAPTVSALVQNANLGKVNGYDQTRLRSLMKRSVARG